MNSLHLEGFLELGNGLQSTPDNSNLRGRLKNVRIIWGSSYRG